MSCHGKKSHVNWKMLGYETDPWQDGTQSSSPKVPQVVKPLPQLPPMSLEPIQETVLPRRRQPGPAVS